MLDLPAKLTIQTNAMQITKEIQAALGKVKANINIVSPASSQRIHLAMKDLQVITKQLNYLSAAAGKATHSIKDVADALQLMRKGLIGVDSESKKAVRGVNDVASSTKQAGTVIAQFGEQAALSAKRYTAWIVAVGGGFAVLRATKDAIKDSIEFQDTLVKMTQVSSKSFTQLKPITNEITRLSTSLGVSSKKLSDVSLVLLQAGLSSRETKKALDALAKVDLAPSFGSIEQAGEAAIAIMHQFGTTTDDLAKQLGAINAVSAEFAVEAEDIVTAITRAGSAFGQLAKDSENPKEALNEFIALFTSVRATTRESAETIATGLRTIFTRLQRASTLQFLRNEGIELTNTLTGRFIGVSESVKKIGEAIKDLPLTDPRVAAIAVEVGGYRQINKTIPLLTQLAEAQRAYDVAKAAGNDLDEAAVQSQNSLQRRLQGLEERFLALFRTIGNSDTFSLLSNSFIKAADVVITLTNALTPLLPLLTAVAAIKFTNLAQEFFPAFKSKLLQTHHAPLATPSFGGISPLHQAGGGSVPGHGTGDTVHAMLTPKEFVIRAPAAKKLGSSLLHRLNHIDKYASGGFVGGELEKLGFTGQARSTESLSKFKVPFNPWAPLAKFKDEIAKLPEELKKFGQAFKVVTDETLKAKGRRGEVRSKSKELALTSGADVGVLRHEVGHVAELAIKDALGLQQLPSHVKGSYVSNTIKEFSKVRAAESAAEGISAKKAAYRQKPHELQAELFSRLSDQGKQIYLHKAMNDPVLKAAATNRPFGESISVHSPASSGRTTYPTAPGYSQNVSVGMAAQQAMHQALFAVPQNSSFSPLDFSGLSSNTSRMSRASVQAANRASNRRNRFRGFYGSGGSIAGGLSTLTGGAISGLRNYAGRGAGFIRGLDEDKIRNAGIAGAVASPFLFGSVAEGKTREERHRGVIGETLSGAFGGAAAGSVAGPLGAAAGAVLGFTGALMKATKEVQTADFQDSLEKAMEGVKRGEFGGAAGQNLIGDLSAASSADFLDNLGKLGTGTGVREGIGSIFSSLGQGGGPLSFGAKIYGKAFEDFYTPDKVSSVIGGEGTSSGGGVIDAKKHAQVIKAHEKELTELLNAEGKKSTSGFSSLAEFKKSGAYFGGKNTIGSLQRFEFLSGKSAHNKEGLEAYKRSIGFGTGGDTRVDILHDSMDDDIDHFKKLSDALESSVEATKGFSHGLDLAEAALSGKAGTLNLVDRSGLIKNSTNATFGETSKELDKLLGGKSGGAKFASFINANIGQLAGDVKNGRGLGGPNTTEALNESFNSLLSDFEKKGFAGGDMGGAHNIAGKIRQSFTNIIGNNETNLPGKTKQEIEALLGKAYSGLSDALADLSKRLTENGNELINTFARTSEAMNNVAHERFQVGNLEVEARNKAEELSGHYGITETNRAGFNSLQATLGGRGGLSYDQSFSPSAIQKAIIGIENEKSNLAATGGATIEQTIGLNSKSQALVAALNNLKGAVNQNSNIEKQLVDLNTKREEGISLESEFRGSNAEGRAKLNRGIGLTQLFNQGALDVDSLGHEDFNLLHETINKMKHLLPDVEEQFKTRLSNGRFGLSADEEQQRMFNQGDIVGNMNLSARAIQAGANIQENQIGQINAGAIQKFELLNAPLLDKFNEKFEKAVSQLEAIPREFTLRGEHRVEVVINGAEAFAKMQPAIQEFVQARITQGIDNLTSKLRAKPPAGPGLPV